MRENTRCDVEEPISTPTVRRQISSSSASVRPVLEKKMRPPSASSVIWQRAHDTRHLSPLAGRGGASGKRGRSPWALEAVPIRRSSFLWQLALVILVVELRLHPVVGAVAAQGLFVFAADERVLHPIRDGGAAFGNVHGGVIDMGLARRSGLAAGIVRTEPGGEAQRLLRGAEMLVEPAGAAGRCRDHADRLVIDALDLGGLAVLPRRHAGALRPRIGVALALEADENGGRRVGVRLGIAAVLVLADPQIKHVAGHERLDAAEAG